MQKFVNNSLLENVAILRLLSMDRNQNQNQISHWIF